MTAATPIDWARVRRRIEDRLRKDIQAVRACAKLLNIKTREEMK